MVLTEKQILELRLLDMESLVHDVVHDNTNLQARLKGLELNKSILNVPAIEKTRVSPATIHPHASTSAQKEKKLVKPPKPPTKLLHLCNLPNAPACAVQAVLVHILCELYRLSEGTQTYDKRAEEIYEWIRINASPTLRTRDVAAHFGYSRDHVTRILRKAYGCGVSELRVRFVCASARELLCNTGLYIKEISHRLGFADDKAFIGFFKYHEGVFPEQFRRRFSRTHMNNR